MTAIYLRRFVLWLSSEWMYCIAQPKFKHTFSFTREELHWLPMPKRIRFKILIPIGVIALYGLRSIPSRGIASESSIPSRRFLRSTAPDDLAVLPAWTSTVQHWGFFLFFQLYGMGCLTSFDINSFVLLSSSSWKPFFSILDFCRYSSVGQPWVYLDEALYK